MHVSIDYVGDLSLERLSAAVPHLSGSILGRITELGAQLQPPICKLEACSAAFSSASEARLCVGGWLKQLAVAAAAPFEAAAASVLEAQAA